MGTTQPSGRRYGMSWATGLLWPPVSPTHQDMAVKPVLPQPFPAALSPQDREHTAKHMAPPPTGEGLHWLQGRNAWAQLQHRALHSPSPSSSCTFNPAELLRGYPQDIQPVERRLPLRRSPCAGAVGWGRTLIFRVSETWCQPGLTTLSSAVYPWCWGSAGAGASSLEAGRADGAGGWKDAGLRRGARQGHPMSSPSAGVVLYGTAGAQHGFTGMHGRLRRAPMCHRK